MNQPLITGVTLTYGRVHYLEEAIACFLAQSYENKRLLVYNTFPRQQLVLDHPQVTLVNCTVRPPSLGEARNQACSMVDDSSVIVVVDDDDLMLPNHFENFADGWSLHPDAEWIRLNPVFFSERWEIKKTFEYWANAVAFTKSAWKKIGGYPKLLSVGEDRALIQGLSQQCSGHTVELALRKVSGIYCWSNGVHHISGQGDDQPDKPVTAYQRCRKELERRIMAGQEPIGRVELKPKLRHIPQMMRRKFIPNVEEERAIRKQATCLVMLGRNGDIVNILPIAHHLYNRTGEKPYLMVSREFADLLEGVSYVEKDVVNFHYSDLDRALKLAREAYGKVICCQVYGRGHEMDPKETESYNKESWKAAGFLEHFDSREWIPVFDRRNLDREKAVAKKLFRVPDKPKILTCLSGGMSSKFEGGMAFSVSLRQWMAPTHEVVEVGQMRLDRIYDLLGLIERSALLITSDTAALHLAAACNTPVIALVNPKPWLGTVPRCNCIARIPYTDADSERVAKIAKEYFAHRENEAPRVVHMEPVQSDIVVSDVEIFHAVERHQGPEQPRKLVAWKSWDALYAQGVIPCHYWKYKRDARDIKDVRPLPYLKDVLAGAMEQAAEDDIILWTNDDVCLHPELPKLLRQHIALFEACTSQRIDFETIIPPLSTPPAMCARLGIRHMGRDLLAASKAWLVRHWDQFPDFILGASDFDLCLACMVRAKWKVETDRKNIEEIFYPAELPPGYVLHQKHNPYWNKPDNANSAPSQLHNRRLFRDWAKGHLPNLKFHESMTI